MADDALPPVYTSRAPKVPTAAELRARIPGWGADRDAPPSMPMEVAPPPGQSTSLPPAQPKRRFRERSVEHEQLPPVFGTSVPLREVSGIIRRLAYWRLSEARTRRWMLLMAADRVDVVENRLRAAIGAKFGKGRP